MVVILATRRKQRAAVRSSTTEEIPLLFGPGVRLIRDCRWPILMRECLKRRGSRGAVRVNLRGGEESRWWTAQRWRGDSGVKSMRGAQVRSPETPSSAGRCGKVPPESERVAVIALRRRPRWNTLVRPRRFMSRGRRVSVGGVRCLRVAAITDGRLLCV